MSLSLLSNAVDGNGSCERGKRAALFGGVSTSVKKGGNQIEYADQDPRVHELFVKETAKNGVAVRMQGLISP